MLSLLLWGAGKKVVVQNRANKLSPCFLSGQGSKTIQTHVVRREIRGLQPSAAILQHSPKQKSEKLNLANADIYVAPFV